MNLEYSNGNFQPYKSFDSIFENRILPEFGNVESPFVREISTWRFMLADGESQIPFGFEAQSFDDEDWDIMNVPSTWQMEGYGLPQNLLYNYPEELQRISKRGEETISDKYLLTSNNSASDEIGIYRASVVFTPEDIDRAIYLEMSGIAGNFDVYLNGQLQVKSASVNTNKRLLLSDAAHEGVNQLTILVYRWERDNHGKIVKELMNYGFSGIYRPVYVVTEPLIEISNLHISVQSVPEAYVNQFTDEKSLEKKLVSKITRGCYQLKADFKIKNHTDYMLPYAVRVSVMEARAEYDPYKFPYAKIDIKATPGGTVDAHQSITDSFELTAVDVAQWSDATPVQYDLILELLDSEERVVCAKKRRFGFRTTEIVHNKFSINDKALPLLLTKYYEFDSKGGISVPVERYRQDIILMKRCGINGIISQGFPLSELMLNLCDEYGVYVIAVADARYMRDYVESAMNHPCVIMWGFNDYGFNSADCLKVKSDCSRIDSTRPWYCGVDFNMSVSDVYPMPCEAGVVFGPWQDLCIDRSYVFGNNKLSKNLFETVPGRTHFADDGADYKWIHHADLVGGKQKANSSIGQGIVDSERNPHPIFHDIRKQCQSINIFASPDEPQTLTMRNNHPFAYTPDLVLEWKVLLGGTPIMSGKGNITEIEPDGIRTLRFPIDIDSFSNNGWANGNQGVVDVYNKALSHEIVFDISLKLASNTYYASENFEIAFYQDVLVEKCAHPGLMDNANQVNLISDNSSLVSDGELIIEETLFTSDNIDSVEVSDAVSVVAQPDSLIVGNEKYSFSFARNGGALNSIRISDKEFLMGKLVPSFYRCPSNIDRTDRNFVLAKTIFSRESDYEEIQESLEYAGSTYSMRDGSFSYISKYKSFAMKGDVIVAYQIDKSDELEVTLCFTPKYDMIRYGFRMPIAKDEVLCTWYGRGPGESYYDRKNATRIGVFSAGADKIYHPYARPAENSSHTDTEVVKFSTPEGENFTVTRVTGANKKFDFTVLPFTPEQMNEFLHEELLMQNDFCELFIDFCSKEIERTLENNSSLPLKKNVTYKETFKIKLS